MNIYDIPKTDAEAEAALRIERDELVGACLIGIFRCRRKMGESVISAYERALLAHVESFTKEQSK